MPGEAKFEWFRSPLKLNVGLLLLIEVKEELIMGLDTVELVMAFEEKFGINIPNEDAGKLSTPRKVTDYVMTTATGKGMTRDEVAAIVRKVVEEKTAVNDFHEDSHFVYDMNLD